MTFNTRNGATVTTALSTFEEKEITVTAGNNAAIRKTPSGYDLVSRLNHWIVAAGFLGALGLGLVMAYGGLAREEIGPLMGWHKALGVSVLLYGVWRVGWRLAQGFPAPVARMPRWQEKASQWAHYALLAAIIAMPLSGVMMTLAGGRALEIAGMTLLPALGKSEALDAVADWIHGFGGYAIPVLLALHIGAALKHHFVDRDATLKRMLRGATRKRV